MPPLPYAENALEPHISGQINEIHHSKHHAAYVKGVNDAVAKLEEARAGDDHAAIFLNEKNLAFHLGGHVNHSIWWKNLSPNGGDKPTGELPMLFQRILSNSTLDWFRRQKTRNALFSSLSDFEGPGEDGADFDFLEVHAGVPEGETAQSAEDSLRRAQVLRAIETEIQLLPARQREAFLMRYWEEMDVAETAAAMGCSQGSVKTHCSRATHALAAWLSRHGVTL